MSRGLGRKSFAHGFSRIGTDFWVTCSGLCFLAIELSSCLAIWPYENEDRGSRLIECGFPRMEERGSGAGLWAGEPEARRIEDVTKEDGGRWAGSSAP